MPTEPRDLVTEARELLAKRTVKPYLTMTLQQRTDNATFDARAPELLRQLADEVERLREENTTLRTCDTCERKAIQRVCRNHGGRP